MNIFIMLFTLAAIIFILAAIIGMIKPTLVIGWAYAPTRGKAFLFYSYMSFVALLALLFSSIEETRTDPVVYISMGLFLLGAFGFAGRLRKQPKNDGVSNEQQEEFILLDDGQKELDVLTTEYIDKVELSEKWYEWLLLLDKKEQEIVEYFAFDKSASNYDDEFDRLVELFEKYEGSRNLKKLEALLECATEGFPRKITDYLFDGFISIDYFIESLGEKGTLLLDKLAEGNALSKFMCKSEFRSVLLDILVNTILFEDFTSNGDKKFSKLLKCYPNITVLQEAVGQFKSKYADEIAYTEETKKLDAAAEAIEKKYLQFFNEAVASVVPGACFENYHTKQYSVLHVPGGKRNWVFRVHLKKRPVQLEFRNERKVDLETVEALFSLKEEVAQYAKSFFKD